MGVWVKCNKRMLEVTSFKINDKKVLKENGMFMLEKEGILLYSADAEILMVDYESERYAYLAFNRLIKHIARLEMITRCLQGTDTSILGDPDMDDSLDELCNNMIFKLPCDKNEYCKMFEEPKEVKHYDED